MNLKEAFAQLNIVEEARRYGIPVWQSPQFLFIVMGIIIIISTVVSYLLGVRYIGDPQISVLLILFLASFQLIIAFVITRSFERLVEANRLKSEFVSIVSHQLRAPLTNLKWALDFLKSDVGGDLQKSNYVQILNENALRMQELVNELLVLSRIEQGKLPLQNQEFSIQELGETVLDEFEPFVRASNIELRVESDGELPRVFSDASRVRQIMANLLDNAIRYSKKANKAIGQRKIVVRYFRKGRFIRFEVEDNGIGIPREDQRYIFTKFFRSKNAVRHQAKGTGLGLHIAGSIIEKAGGTIGFHSREGEGSTFWFELPIKA